EVLVDDDAAFGKAQEYMQRFMPTDAQRRLKHYTDDIALFTRFQIESQIESAYAHKVQLPSGGSIVIDYTEALVSIDINSARATRGSDIETTATNTNLEAADEIARQLRIRDIGGLIVIDFIDMESSKNQREVEDRLRDAVKMDRARIQIGRLSRFGLLEMSRQRLRPSLGESSHIVCPRCVGIGSIRSVESMTLAVLRLIGEELRKDRTARVIAQVPVSVATYLINEKREWLRTLEDKSEAELIIVPNENIQTPEYSIKRVRADEMELPEQRQATYLMPTAPEVAEPGTQERKPPQEAAVVAPLLPATSAPIGAQPEPSAPAARAQGGFWSRFKRMLAGEPTTSQAPEPAPEVSAPRAARAPRRDDGQRRDGRREHSRHGRYADGARRERDGRRDGRDRERGRDQGERDRNRDRSRRHEPPGERSGERAGERVSERNVDRNNGERERNAPSEAPRPELAGANQGSGPSGEGRAGPEGRSRGRRGRRRGRRGGGGAREGLASGAGEFPPAAEAAASGNGEHDMPNPPSDHEAQEPARERRPEPAAPAAHESRSEPREPATPHESVPLGHFEPTPRPEPGNAPNKPYVVWTSAPSQKDAGDRGPEE
ncbi:MAG TPA: ribonuclease E/G, partial [Steroidobacteraceae bacterium]